jgi:glycosyltransferase involved in cell wall biosynthesis
MVTHKPVRTTTARRDTGAIAALPLVSVIVPVFNGEAFIEGALDSALGQTYPRIEVIVVDDGSQDRTRAVVEARAAREPRVRLICQTNSGVAAARNRAIEHASGDFVAPLDADDVWDSTKIERQVARMRETSEQTGLVYCWWASIDVDNRIVDTSPQWRVEGAASERLLSVNWTGNASVPLYRRRCLEEVGGYGEIFRERAAEGCEDWDLALRVAERFDVAVVPAVLVGYRRHREGMSARTDAMRRSYALVIQRVRQRRGNVSEALILRSRDQFALYLAGVCFWSGAHARAFVWTLRSLRSPIAIHVFPYVALLLVKTALRRGSSHRELIRPGVPFSSHRLPTPAIPYERIYDGGRKPLARRWDGCE